MNDWINSWVNHSMSERSTNQPNKFAKTWFPSSDARTRLSKRAFISFRSLMPGDGWLWPIPGLEMRQSDGAKGDASEDESMRNHFLINRPIHGKYGQIRTGQKGLCSHVDLMGTSQWRKRNDTHTRMSVFRCVIASLQEGLSISRSVRMCHTRLCANRANDA